MPQTFVLPRQVSFGSGEVAPLSVCRFYQTGTTTPQAVYLDAALTNGLTSITADSAGVFPKVYLNPGASADYRVRIETATGTLIYQEDEIGRLPMTQEDVGSALYPTSEAEDSGGVVPVNFAYPYGNLLRYGADPTGSTASDSAITSCQNAGYQCYAPRGDYLFTATIAVKAPGFIGDGPNLTKLRFVGVDAFTLASDEGLDRPACIIQGFSVDASTSTNCDGKYFFKAAGVASGATAAYNSGINVRDVEVGRTNRFGGLFYVKDVFRMNVKDVGGTNISHMIRIVGSVVQCKFQNVTSNNDTAGSALSLKGISTETATYSGSTTLTPENIRFIDCAYIRGTTGIDHQAGLLIEFQNFDCETTTTGMSLNAECRVIGGLVAPQATATSWVGVLRGVSPSNDDAATIIDGLDINCLNVPGTPSSSYGIDAGDNVSPIRGLVVRNCRIRGSANSLQSAFRGRILNDCTFEDNFIRTTTVTGTNDVDITASTRLFFRRNRNDSGVWSITDGGDSAAYGEISGNKIATLTFTPTAPNNWNLMFNESGLPVRRFPHALTGSTTYDPASIADGDDVATTVTVTGAAVGDVAVATLSTIGARSIMLSAHVSATDTVRVSLHNIDGSSHDLDSGTLRAWVFKAS